MSAPRHLRYLNERVVEAVTDRTQQRFIIIEASVRHAKSTLCTHALPTWHMGMYPEDPVFVVTYSDDFSSYWGGMNRDIFRRVGPELFGLTVDDAMAAAGQWRVKGHRGIMYSVGVGGLINGLGAGLILLDDPIKNNTEALSPAYRNKLRDFYYSSCRTRLAPWGTLILVMARWHEDDLSGHLQELMRAVGYVGDQWEVIHLPAIAEAPRGADVETWRDEIGRAEGEELWPEMWPKRILDQIKGSIDDATWSALYQQSPTSREGVMFHPDKWVAVDGNSIDRDRVRMCRYWDTAATSGAGDWTVGALVSLDEKNTPTILDIQRVRYSTSDVEDLVLATAKEDGHIVPIRMEQQRAGSGNAEIDRYARLLVGFDFAGQRPFGIVEERAKPMASVQQKGFFQVVRGHWNDAFFNEAAAFPKSRHDDQIDAVSGAFNEIAAGGTTTITPIELMTGRLGVANPFGRW